MKFAHFFLLLFLMTPIYADDAMVVHLTTDNQRMPLYLAPFTREHSDIDTATLNQLEAILRFDLENNGMTQVVKQTDTLNALARSIPYKARKWQEERIFYLVKVTVKKHALDVKVYSPFSGVRNTIQDIPITGSLKNDRHQMHRVADAIYTALFDEPGIATTRILYTLKMRDPREKGSWISEVWEADYDGKNPRQVTHDDGYCITPTYVPPEKGKRSGSLFYVSYKTGQPKIYLASLKEGKGQRFTLLRGNQLMPIVSPKRDQVAFINDVTGNPDLFVLDFSPEKGAQGKPRQIFSAGVATQGTPTFSPDGTRVAFVSNKDGTPRIYAMDIPHPDTPLKQIKAKLLTKYSRGATAPAWSPDGTKIAYCARVDGIRQILLYDFIKDEERQITDGPNNKENPTWAPNSLVLIYNTTDHNKGNLYITPIHTPHPTQITTGSGEKRFPAWENR